MLAKTNSVKYLIPKESNDPIVTKTTGQTTAESLAPLCRRHNRLKTRGDWQLHSDGTTTRWVSPNGTSTTNEADPPLPGP